MLSAISASGREENMAFRRGGFELTPPSFVVFIISIPLFGGIAESQTKPTTQPIFPKVDLPAFELSKEPDDQKAAQMTKRQDVQRLRAWWLDRMCRTDKPLEEKMTLFWHGLFCSGFMEVKDADFMFQQNQLLRKEAVGNYKRLAHEIVHDPAMLRVWTALMQVGNFIATVLVTPIFTIATSIFYFDLRVRKEAFDLQLMMDPLSGGVPAPRGATTLLS